MAKAVITLDDKNIFPLYQYTDNDGNITEKYVRTEDLIKSLSQMYLTTSIWKTPVLPKGVIHYTETSTGGQAILEFDTARVPVRLHDAIVNNVNFPRLLFAFSLNGNTVGSVHIVAIKDREITENTLLYEYPFSNVTDQKACWSELPIQLNSLSELSRIPYRWFGSENTFCYYGSNNLSGMDYRQYLEHNASRDEFDWDTLKPLNITFGDWIQKTIG